MGFLKFFHSTRRMEAMIQRERECMARIKDAVSQRTGVAEFIEWDDFTVAFAGSRENMELMLELRTCKYEGKDYLYASVDDEVSWQEWDYEDSAEFERNIINFIANRVNRTVKTVTRASKDSFQITSWYLEEDGNWVCFEDDSTDKKWFSRIVYTLTESSEVIKTYRLEK